MRQVAKIVVVCGIALCQLSCSPKAPPAQSCSDQGRLYVTWDTLEADKLASIWLIKRFIDPQARFEFVAKGTLITNGIPFDTPDSDYRRYHAISCYQSIVRQNKTEDPALLCIGEITHDIEVNFWGEKRFPESAPLDERLKAVIAEHPADPEGCVTQALPILDELLVSVRSAP